MVSTNCLSAHDVDDKQTSLIGSAFARIFFGAPLAFCSPKEELLRLRDAGASQGGSFLPPRKRAQRVVTSSKYFGNSWAAARGGVPTRVASAAERAPQMAPEARGKVPPEMPKVWTSVDFNGGVGGGSSRQPKEQKGTSRQPQACPWRTRRATRSPHGA